MNPPQFNQNMNEEQRQMLMQQQQNNPFNIEQYRNVQVPDIPMGIQGGIADSLLNDDEVPEKVRKEWWPVFHKDNTLTFLDPERKAQKLLNFDIMKIDRLHSMPYYDYTFEEELKFTVLRNVFETKLDRALGLNNSNVKNERIMLNSQFQENRQISEHGVPQNFMRESFFRRLLGRR